MLANIKPTQLSFAYDPTDSDEIRIEKFAIFLVSTACCLAGLGWTVMYYAIFGWGFTTLLPLLFTIIVGTSLVVSHLTRNHRYTVYAQIICIIYIPAIIQWNIGGVFDAGLVMMWSFLGPMIALMFFPQRIAVIWFLLFLANLAITVIFDPFFVAHGQVIPDNIRLFFFAMNMSIASTVVFIFASYFVSRAISERIKANNLLLNVLPREITPVLKGGKTTIADYYDSASVLFADIVGSTPLFSDLEPAEAVDWLHEVFTLFDRLVEKHEVEKIRTIGDNYMVVSGAPTPRANHAQRLAALALDMVQGLDALPDRSGKRLAFRLGINSGPMVAGVIGQTKFHYDVWGDTVNTASRMESHGEAGKVHITRSTYELLKDEFECVYRGQIPVKGKGDMDTWYVVGRANRANTDGVAAGI